jgi:hypothetical protein
MMKTEADPRWARGSMPPIENVLNINYDFCAGEMDFDR